MAVKQEECEVPVSPDQTTTSFSSFPLPVLFLLLLSAPSRGLGRGAAEVWHPRLSALGLENRPRQDYTRDTALKVCQVPRCEWLYTGPLNAGLHLSVGNVKECIFGRRRPPLADQSRRWIIKRWRMQDSSISTKFSHL